MATTFPANTTKANFDAGTDDPKQARSEFATNADIQNDLKSALGAFAQLSNPAGSGFELVTQAAGTPDDVRVFHKHERKTANYLAVAGDRSKLLEFDKVTAITLNLTAAATLTNGWFINVNNSGAGTLTIDPNAAEVIDDAATITLEQNQSTVVFCDGTSFWTVGRTVAAGGLLSVQVFTADTTWTKPAAVNLIIVEVQAGGGGGGGAATNVNVAGGGGGGGGYSRELLTGLASSEVVTVGAGGLAGTSGGGTGGTGGTSSLGSLLSATGGAGGGGATTGVDTVGGVGGIGSGGSFNTEGTAGSIGAPGSGSGKGGSSHLGGGAVGRIDGSNQAGVAGGQRGGGASGGYRESVNAAGGAGAGGIVIVWEYS